LRRDGSIQIRYGDGNANLKRVIVGISGGQPDAYLVGSHSSEAAPLSLTNAQTITFALRNPPPPPISDIAITLKASPEPVVSGQNLVYQLELTNLGPNPADLPVMTVLLPAGTTFVSCATHFAATCTNTSGTITGKLDILGLSAFSGAIPFTITVKVDAAAGASLNASASVTSARPDPNPVNNSASVTSNVVAQAFFGNARAIAAGNSHTVSVRNDGTVWTWGLGTQGQLGDGTSGNSSSTVRAITPLQVPGIDGVEAVEDSNGFGFVLALKSNGTVWGWGNDFNAQLGDGAGNVQVRTRPVQTVGLTNVKGIASGDVYGAAVKTDGTVWIWGAPVLTGGFNLITVPIQLSGIANVTAIAGGNRHLLMLKSDKTVWAIGLNSMGQLGNGNTNSTTPLQVASLSNVARIAAGDEFSLALKEDGTIWAWGNNSNGQLGPGGGNTDFNPHPNPVQVTGLPGGMANISAGGAFCLALAGDGTIWSWGKNSSFQLGRGSGSSATPTPGQIPNFGNVVSIAGGVSHSVALKNDGSVWSWGLNLEGEVGDSTTNTVRTVPVRVSGLITVNAPMINPGSGKFFNSVNVTITSPTPGATIHYTTNSTEPTENDPEIASGGTLQFTTTTVLRTRAWRPGMFPSGTSFAGFETTVPNGPPSVFLAHNPPAPNLVAAFDSILRTTDPFFVVNPANLLRNPNDPNTRVVIFALNLELFLGETPAAVTVNLTDANGGVHNVPAEDVRFIPGGLGFTQVTFRLPNNLPPGTCQVKIVAHSLTSNVGAIRIMQ
jgi:uncharacterized repeat protein (TIGR01451 family)